MEYATREQAQQAVTTLSNQNLMGRLVYVREVCGRFGNSGPCVASITPTRSLADWNIRIARIEKLSHDSRDLLRAATSAVDLGAAMEVATAELLRVEAAVVRFTSPTFVVPTLSGSGLKEAEC